MAYYAFPDFIPHLSLTLAWAIASMTAVVWNITWGTYTLSRLNNKRARCAMSRHVWVLDTEPMAGANGSMTVFLKIHCLMCEETIQYTLRTELDQSKPDHLEVLHMMAPTITGDRHA